MKTTEADLEKMALPTAKLRNQFIESSEGEKRISENLRKTGHG